LAFPAILVLDATLTFKVIYAPDKIQGSKTIAFIMPNVNVSKKGIWKFIVPIKEVEERTGLNFLPNVPTETRMIMVNQKSTMWPTHFHHSKRRRGHSHR
jgi:endonuclease G